MIGRRGILVGASGILAAGGARAAFLCGAVISLVAVVCALFVRKPVPAQAV